MRVSACQDTKLMSAPSHALSETARQASLKFLFHSTCRQNQQEALRSWSPIHCQFELLLPFKDL